MSRLVATDVTVRRGGRAIVDGACVSLPAGAFVAVVGANGAGKSTLLSVLAGLLRPDEGEVSLDGAALEPMNRRDLAKQRAYLPQNPRAEWPISVERLVALGLTPHLPAFGGLDGGVEPRLTETLAACDLLDHRLQPATTLSGGELSRAMLARALIGAPSILIADEPIAGLDPRHALDAAVRLQSIALQGRLVVVSLHDLTIAARYATHILAMCEGRIIAFGSTREVLTPSLLKTVFDVEAAIIGEGHVAYVDFRTSITSLRK